MTPTKHAEQSIHSLILAKISGKVREINKCQARLDYWTERVHDEELKGEK